MAILEIEVMSNILQRLAHLATDKQQKPYSTIMKYFRLRIDIIFVTSLAVARLLKNTNGQTTAHRVS